MKGEIQIFTFRDNSTCNNQFAIASSIVSGADEKVAVCPNCRKIQKIWEGGFDVVIEGGNQFPDILGCGAYPFLIVSTKVVNDWKSNGISNFVQYPVKIVGYVENEFDVDKYPSYFRIEPKGRCQIDLDASGLKILNHCRQCNYLKTYPAVPHGFQLSSGSWDGSEIFCDPDLYPRVMFCSRKVVNLATQFQHTNFRFELMEGPFDHSSCGINYLSDLDS